MKPKNPWKIDVTSLPTFEDTFVEWMKDPEYRREYDALEAEFQLVHALLNKRLGQKMSQKQLADKIGTSQSAIARLESGEGNPSFKFLKRVAEGLDSKLKISFV